MLSVESQLMYSRNDLQGGRVSQAGISMMQVASRTVLLHRIMSQI
jgi:hypothetical protein